jgi:hypothetical protein
LGSNFNPQDTQILRVFLRLKFSPALTSAKLKRFEIGSNEKNPFADCLGRPRHDGCPARLRIGHWPD